MCVCVYICIYVVYIVLYVTVCGCMCVCVSMHEVASAYSCFWTCTLSLRCHNQPRLTDSRCSWYTGHGRSANPFLVNTGSRCIAGTNQ